MLGQTDHTASTRNHELDHSWYGSGIYLPPKDLDHWVGAGDLSIV